MPGTAERLQKFGHILGPRVNQDLRRPSRLFRSIPSYIQHSIMTIVRIFVVYKPFRFFFIIGATLLILGKLIGLRFLWYYFAGDGAGGAKGDNVYYLR
ncbi:hypothetical protein [Desulfonatronospira sp.]|uniref:hypothetical protein n=1 Tax=Desulfonatronospira sp. TaxID=1962951 RepID=UPI0025BFEC81|nr:hypothetical protein [Desulfonatronospira sp.]